MQTVNVRIDGIIRPITAPAGAVLFAIVGNSKPRSTQVSVIFRLRATDEFDPYQSRDVAQRQAPGVEWKFVSSAPWLDTGYSEDTKAEDAFVKFTFVKQKDNDWLLTAGEDTASYLSGLKEFGSSVPRAPKSAITKLATLTKFIAEATALAEAL
jgi:hypothetical protein